MPEVVRWVVTNEGQNMNKPICPKDDSPLIDGYQLYHNYIRPHMGLDGKTPAEKCGVKIEGDNKWLTLIQNASKNKASF